MTQLAGLAEAPATSSREGTQFPRHGLFYGTHPPAYQTPVVLGELSGIADEAVTPVPSWTAPHAFFITQTVSPTLAGQADIRLHQFVVELEKSFPLTPPRVISTLQAGSFSRSVALGAIRDTDVAVLFVPTGEDVTVSAWQKLRDALSPLRAASAAVLELIDEQLRSATKTDDSSEHVGLAAVAWLERVLQLSRPVILRMGGVPESTFYAWQKSPGSAVRTPSVARLLRLQAHVGLLADALGIESVRTWIMSGHRLERLQADEDTFGGVWDDADELMTPRLAIRGRKRMRLEDYRAGSEVTDSPPDVDLPPVMGARKAPATPTK